ncbi:cytidylate kinase [Linnemannia elongata]|nr:cytidylate kinase [Linnemannia elongata]
MASRNIATRLITRTFSSASKMPQKDTRPFQVAIDGPAASGKSTTAKMVAQRLGFDYIDTGAFYRCVTLAALSKGIDPSKPSQASQISNLAQSSQIGLKTVFSNSSSSLPTTRVFLDEKDVSSDIRTETVSKHVSAVAAIGPVREAVLQKVRDMGATSASTSQESNSGRAGLVMDGRDIGTVVLPNADLKIFLVADSRVRAERRLQELAKSGRKEEELDVETVQKDLERRDELDRTREASPLRKADDAVELDTSHLTIEGQVDAIVQEVYRRQKAASSSTTSQ